MSDLLTKCEVCGGLIDEEDLFCANCGAEAPERAQSAADTSRESTHNFRCTGCGASMSYDAQAGGLRCPFCGSTQLEKQADAKVLAPRRVVPFATSREQAVDSMRKFLGRGFWKPGDLATRAMVVTMTPVYVPYWIFRAETHTYWTADTDQLPAYSSGDWRPLSGEHHGRYENLLIGASGALTPRETHEICPFDLSTAADPDRVNLEKVTVEQFSVMRKYARPLARQGLENLEASACTAQYVPGKCRNMQVNTRIEGLSSEPVLLPIWIMAYRYNKKLFRFLVNGQSGQATGQAPISLKKVFAVGGLVIGVLILILIAAMAR
jgi:DNA-directed RNA polymerase subunit RPC12/RpoP